MGLFKRIWGDSVWSQVIAGLIVAWITAFLSKNTTNIFMLLLIASFLIIVGTLIYQWSQHKNSGFAFDENTYFLGMGGNQKEIQIYSFQAIMQSKFQISVKSFSGYVQSNLTNETFPIYLNVDGMNVPPEKTNGIPPKALFTITAPFTGNNPDEAGPPLTPGEFSSKIGDFTLVLYADDKIFVFKFPLTKSQKLIEKFRKQTQPVVKPKITLKQ